MNFESLEQMRYEATKKVIEAMADIACDEKADVKDRMKAAKIVDGMSDSIIKAFLLKEVTDSSDSNNKKLIKQLDKLTDKDDD